MDYFASQPALLFFLYRFKYFILGSKPEFYFVCAQAKSYRDFEETGPRPPCPSRHLVTQRKRDKHPEKLVNVQQQIT